jgi:DNA-binding NarL/FixJ family response regulator
LNDSSVDQLASAIRIVSTGAGWLDPQIAARILKSSGAAYLAKAGRSTDDTSSYSDAETMCEPTAVKRLSSREQQVLAQLVKGMSNHDMAKHFCLSPETIKTHVSHVISKLKVKTRTEAALKAVRQGLTN